MPKKVTNIGALYEECRIGEPFNISYVAYYTNSKIKKFNLK